MAKVRAITGASADEFADLTRKAKELGLETAQTMTDIAAGMEAFGRAGFSATEIISAMDGAVALAESQVMDLGEAVGITANILRGMRLEASESERVVNALAAAASSSNTTVSSLAGSMKYFAPIMADLNIPLEEGLALIGKLGDAGLTGTMATRALATAFTRLADPTTEMQEVMEELNIEFFDARGNFVGITPMIALLEDRFAGLTQEQRQAAISTLFGAEALKHFSILLGVGAEDITTYTEKITGTTKAFDQQAEMLDTLSGQWQILKGSVELLLVTIGIDMMPILKTFLKDRIIPIVNNMTSWIEKMGGLKGIFAALKGKVKDWAREHEPLISAFVRAKDAVVKLWNTVKDAFRAIGKALGLAGEDAQSLGTTFVNGLTVAVNIVADLLDVVSRFINFLLRHKASTVAAISAITVVFLALKAVQMAKWFAATISGMTLLSAILSPAGLLVMGLGLITIGFIEARKAITSYSDAQSEAVEASKDLEGAFSDLTDSAEDVEKAGVILQGGINLVGSRLAELVQTGGLSIITLRDITDKMGDLREEVMKVPVSEMAQAWAEGVSAILGEYEEILPGIGSILDDLVVKSEEKGEEAGEALTEGVVRTVEEGIPDIEGAGEDTGEAYTEGVATGVMNGSALILKAEETLQTVWDALRKGHHKDAIEEERTFWDDFVDVVKDSGAEVGNVMADMWDSLKSLAKSALGDTLNGIVDHFRDQRRLAEEHADRMLDIEEDYNQDAADLQYTRQDDSKDAELSYQRRVEDIERRHRRELQGITGEDTEERARIETRYREDMEDATTNYARRREDIEEDYSDAVIAQERRREQALADERQEYKDTQKSLWGVLGDMLHDLLTALREELFVKAASHAVEALAWSFIPPLFFLNPQAIGHAAAAAAFAAGGAGLAIAGFGEGAVFEQPTMIPPALVGESGYKEAFLPLSPSIFGEIGQGIVDALSVPTPAPVLVGAGGGTTINMDWRGLYDGATINVRDDQDITRIAREHFDLFRSRLRSKGRDIG